jgi:hypothetical protein
MREVWRRHRLTVLSAGRIKRITPVALGNAEVLEHHL